MWIDIAAVGQEGMCEGKAAIGNRDLDMLSGEKLETIRVCGGGIMVFVDGIATDEVENRPPHVQRGLLRGADRRLYRRHGTV